MNHGSRSKKIATMTFHLAHNYGAMLQAYALATAIKKMGYRCEVLDYRFPYIDQWSGIHTWKDLIQCNNLFIGTAKYCRRILHGYYDQQELSQKKFNSFMRRKIPVSFKTYFSPEQLREAKYDVIFFGSDQIWNSKLTNGIAPEYFGAYFDTDRTRLVSYAASCGKAVLPPEEKEQLYPMLQRFTALGIREEGFTQFLRSDYGLDAQTVIDPVMLLTVNDWDSLLGNIPAVVDEPYLLVYAFDVGKDIYHLARRIASERKLKLVSVGYQKDDTLSDIQQLTDCGPMEFLWLIRNASFVCTSSFHAEAFSILFQKNFYCMGHPLYSQRNSDLLKLLGLQGRLIHTAEDVRQIRDCDFTAANVRVEEERDAAIAFLRDAIEKE